MTVAGSVDQRPILVIMGVTGSGKSTIAGLLAGRLGWDLAEGDDMHPAANVAKMSAGHPLDDSDRWPWLAKIAQWITQHAEAGKPGIITCSALKRSYRDVLRGDHVVFVYLAGTPDQLSARLVARHGHFMPPALLSSQLSTLQPPDPDERAITVDIGGSAEAEAEQIVTRLQLAGATAPARLPE